MDRPLSLTASFQLSPQTLYQDWLDSRTHSAFTGSPGEIDPRVGGKFSTWEGYIQGVIKELHPGKRILQSWRTTEFPQEAPDSTIEISFESYDQGALLSL